jgi:hypothetical protein
MSSNCQIVLERWGYKVLGMHEVYAYLPTLPVGPRFRLLFVAVTDDFGNLVEVQA